MAGLGRGRVGLGLTLVTAGDERAGNAGLGDLNALQLLIVTVEDVVPEDVVLGEVFTAVAAVGGDFTPVLATTVPTRGLTLFA